MSLQRGRGQSVCNTEIDWMEKRNCHNDIVWDHELGLPGIDVICDKYLHPEYHEVCVSLDDDEMDGGGGGYNPPSNPPETPPTPCKRAKTLSQDAAFKSRIKDVYRKHFPQAILWSKALYRLQTGKLFSRTYKNQEVPNSQMIKQQEKKSWNGTIPTLQAL